MLLERGIVMLYGTARQWSKKYSSAMMHFGSHTLLSHQPNQPVHCHLILHRFRKPSKICGASLVEAEITLYPIAVKGDLCATYGKQSSEVDIA